LSWSSPGRGPEGTSASTPALARAALGTLSIVNVRDHGATGDGLTDDQAAITAAIAATPAGDVLYFPLGTYLVGGGFIVNKSISILGAGRSTLFRMTGITTSSVLFYVGGSTPNGTPNPGYPGTVYNLGTAALTAGQRLHILQRGRTRRRRYPVHGARDRPLRRGPA
jgi:Pectate lyase superfamily protein